MSNVPRVYLIAGAVLITFGMISSFIVYANNGKANAVDCQQDWTATKNSQKALVANLATTDQVSEMTKNQKNLFDLTNSVKELIANVQQDVKNIKIPAAVAQSNHVITKDSIRRRLKKCAKNTPASDVKWYGQDHKVADETSRKTAGNYDKEIYQASFMNKCDGIFVEVGANDGLTYSQSKAFEEGLNWRGMCVEPLPETFKRLQANRPDCINVHAGITNLEETTLKFLQVGGGAEMLSGFEKFMTEEHKARIKREGYPMTPTEVRAVRLQKLFDEHGITQVDYMSIDVEGNELQVLQSIDFEKTRVDYFFFESYTSEAEKKKITDFFTEKGYLEKKGIAYNRVFVNPTSFHYNEPAEE